MLALVVVSALVCVVCAVIGFGSFVALSSFSQGLLLLISAIAATILLGAFEAYEGERRTSDRTGEA